MIYIYTVSTYTRGPVVLTPWKFEVDHLGSSNDVLEHDCPFTCSDFMWLLVSMLTVGVAAWYYHHPVVGYLLHLPIAGPRTGPFFGSVARSCFENGIQQQRCGNKKNMRYCICSISRLFSVCSWICVSPSDFPFCFCREWCWLNCWEW